MVDRTYLNQKWYNLHLPYVRPGIKGLYKPRQSGSTSLVIEESLDLSMRGYDVLILVEGRAMVSHITDQLVRLMIETGRTQLGKINTVSLQDDTHLRGIKYDHVFIDNSVMSAKSSDLLDNLGPMLLAHKTSAVRFFS